MDGEISPTEVRRLLDLDDPPRVVDIRSPGAFARGHIPGSENVPFAQLTARVESLADEDHIVTVCPVGQSSVQAARLIGSYEGTTDARVESMAGGLKAWEGELVANGDDSRGTNDSPADGADDPPF